MQTFLFTDIEGSTRLWEQHPAAMARAIARHEEILREAIGVRGGTVFNTAGDSVCAVFPTAGRAIAAALDGQRRLLAERWDNDAPGLTLSVRMALDAGDTEASGGNLVGPVLNRLHRLMKTGHGGQLLCTELVAPAGELDAGVELRDLGTYVLRDLPEDTRVFQLVAPGLPADFPPLITDRPAAPNLPVPPNALIGRDGELRHLAELVRDPKVRLLTLTGPGGVGKTTMALALTRQLYRVFPHGACFVDLSAIQEPALVVPAIATTVETADPLLSVEEALVTQLGNRTMLLVLDNCEHVASETARIVARVLSSTATVTVLATSRVPLRIRGEWEAHVSPLPLPVSNDAPSSSPAVQLFAEHARQVNNRFMLDDRTGPAVVDICRMVDGLPLAIELAAAWVRLLDPATLRDRLAEGASLLRSDTRDRPERHRTLTSTIDWSYQLLSPQARWAFGRMAVFQGGVPFDGALAVLQDDGRAGFLESLEVIDALVQANLLQAPEQTADGPRYGMLQTIQEFGRSVLSPAERLEACRAHAMFFASMALAAEGKYRGPEAVVWLDRLESNLDNLRAAAMWLATAEGNDPESSLQMATALWEFLDTRNHLHDARSLLTLALDAAPNASARSRARALAQLGNTWLSNYEQAETYFQASLARAAEIPGEDWAMSAAIGLGSIALLRGNFERARSVARDVLESSRASGDPAAVAQALLVLGSALEYTGHPHEAIAALEESAEISTQIGDVAGRAWAQRLQASACIAIGDTHRSFDLLQQAIAEFEDIGEGIMVALCQLELSRTPLQRHGAPELAQVIAAVEAVRTLADSFTVSSMLDTGASVLLRCGEPEPALELLAATESWRNSTGTVLSITLQQETSATRSQAFALLDPLVASNTLERGSSRSLRAAMDQFLEDLQRISASTHRPPVPATA